MVFYWLEALLLGVTLVALGAIVKLCRDVKKALGRFDRQLPSCPSQDVKFSSSRTRRVFKEPSVFDGNQATFKEWTFAMELALRSLAFADPTEDVDYAIGYLSGNARLWVISALDGGTTYESWDALKKALTSAYGPVHDQERCRLNLFALRQASTLSAYVTDFTRLSLQVPDLDELSRTLLFVKGLRYNLKRQVMLIHPQNLEHAIRSAQTAEQLTNMVQDSDAKKPSSSSWSPQPLQSSEAKLSKLTEQEREELRRTGGCFACRKPGHLARECKAYPNEGRQ